MIITPAEYMNNNLSDYPCENMSGLLFGYSYLTAWKDGETIANNIKSMQALRDELVALDQEPYPCLMYWQGILSPMYWIHCYWLGVEDYLALAKKYGQPTLICLGDIYDVASGKVVGAVYDSDVYRDTTQQPQHPRWIYVGMNCYVLLHCTESVDTYDTLAALSAGRPGPQPPATRKPVDEIQELYREAASSYKSL